MTFLTKYKLHIEAFLTEISIENWTLTKLLLNNSDKYEFWKKLTDFFEQIFCRKCILREQFIIKNDIFQQIDVTKTCTFVQKIQLDLWRYFLRNNLKHNFALCESVDDIFFKMILFVNFFFCRKHIFFKIKNDIYEQTEVTKKVFLSKEI